MGRIAYDGLPYSGGPLTNVCARCGRTRAEVEAAYTEEDQPPPRLPWYRFPRQDNAELCAPCDANYKAVQRMTDKDGELHPPMEWGVFLGTKPVGR